MLVMTSLLKKNISSFVVYTVDFSNALQLSNDQQTLQRSICRISVFPLIATKHGVFIRLGYEIKEHIYRTPLVLWAFHSSWAKLG